MVGLQKGSGCDQYHGLGSSLLTLVSHLLQNFPGLLPSCMKALSIIKKPKKSQSPICTFKRNSSSVTISLWLLPALPHIPLVLFSLGPAAFPGITKMLQWSQWQPRQRRSARPRILYRQQHSFALQIIHLTDLTISYVSTCTQRQKITQIVLLEVFFL